MHSNDPEVNSKRKKIRMEMILKDSDIKKNSRKIIELEMQTRDLKRKKTIIEMDLAKIELETKKIQGLQTVLQLEYKKIKNNLNMLQ
jgi:hypothetical protein